MVSRSVSGRTLLCYKQSRLCIQNISDKTGMNTNKKIWNIVMKCFVIDSKLQPLALSTLGLLLMLLSLSPGYHYAIKYQLQRWRWQKKWYGRILLARNSYYTLVSNSYYYVPSKQYTIILRADKIQCINLYIEIQIIFKFR